MTARSFESPEELAKSCEKYFEECRSTERPLTMGGLCLHLEATRQTISLYMSGEYDSDTTGEKSFVDILERSKLVYRSG